MNFAGKIDGSRIPRWACLRMLLPLGAYDREIKMLVSRFDTAKTDEIRLVTHEFTAPYRHPAVRLLIEAAASDFGRVPLADEL